MWASSPSMVPLRRAKWPPPPRLREGSRSQIVVAAVRYQPVLRSGSRVSGVPPPFGEVFFTFGAAACSACLRRGPPRRRRAVACRAAATQAEQQRNEMVEELLRLSAATDRGQAGTEATRQRCEDLVAALEVVNPTPSPACSSLLVGTWQLVYSSEDPTRCSPFFWALRRSAGGLRDPSPVSRLAFGTDELVEATFAITDSIPLKNVGTATQRIAAGKLQNEVVVGVFVTGESKMTTTSSYVPDPADEGALLLTVEKTQVLGGSLAARLLGQLEFPSAQLLGADSTKVKMNVSYLDDRVRVVRDSQRTSACFVFVRASEREPLRNK